MNLIPKISIPFLIFIFDFAKKQKSGLRCTGAPMLGMPAIPIASRGLGSYIFISLMYPVEVGITFPKHHRSISKKSSKTNPVLTELLVNYH